MISGAHMIIYSSDPEADRPFLRDVLGLTHVDAGEGWLIFALPPSEIAIHPAEESGRHEIFLICEDIEAFVAEVERRGHQTGAVEDHGWGLLSPLALPGGGRVGVYEPRHARPN